MKIAVVGLGLIGGSIAKTLKKNTNHSVYAINRSQQTLKTAISEEAIDGAIDAEELKDMDVVFIGLYAGLTIDFVLKNADKFKKGAVVADTCGVKTEIVKALTRPLAEKGVHFVGCHPMAGREFSGYRYSLDNLFDNASFIITPDEDTDQGAVKLLSDLAHEMRFRKTVISTPQEHDRVIAFTSQLAHIVSASYVKSPSLLKQAGFSAGSFKDMTRVAYLNEDMWTELFMLNKDALSFEIGCVINALQDYKNALDSGDSEKLHELLKESRELKERSDENTAKLGG